MFFCIERYNSNKPYNVEDSLNEEDKKTNTNLSIYISCAFSNETINQL